MLHKLVKMASSFEPDQHTIVPWQARYSFPTQAAKVHKQTVKIGTKGVNEFGANTNQNQSSRMTFEMPADDYANMLNSYIEFELEATSPTDNPNIFDGPNIQLWNSAVDPSIVIYYTAGLPDRSAIAASLAGWMLRAVAGINAGFVSRIESFTQYDDAQDPAVGEATTGGGLRVYHFKLESGMPIPRFGTVGGAVSPDLGQWVVEPGIRLKEAGVHELFSKIVVKYGSLVLEEIHEYNTLARILIKSGVETGYKSSIGTMLDGFSSGRGDVDYASARLGGNSLGKNSQTYATGNLYQGIDKFSDTYARLNATTPQPKTFIFNPFTGIASLKKLLPLKWMAAQLTFEFYFAPSAQAFLTGGTADVQYTLKNPFYVTELLSFDSTYDAAFAQELAAGIPLKFDSFHHYAHNVTGPNYTAQIKERARSVKYMLSVLVDQQNSFYRDSQRFYHALGEYYTGAGKTQSLTSTGTAGLTAFQYRIGGRYFPAQPVNCDNGAAEALVELLKVIDYLGDYSKSNAIDMYTWSSHHFEGGQDFIMGMSTENNDVAPDTISGLNAEEQSDIMISLRAESLFRDRSYDTSNALKTLRTFVAYDALMIVRPGNNVQLVV